jgi:hypothetical protein
MFQLQLFFLLHCDEWDRVVALPRHKFVTGATLLQLYSIQPYVIKFVSDLRQVSGFPRVLRFPPPIILTATI